MAIPVLVNPSYLPDDLYLAITADAVRTRFRFELLDNSGNSKGLLDCVLTGGSVKNNYLDEIKGKCDFTIAEVGNFNQINFITDRVKIWCDIYSYLTNSWLTYPLGVYVMSAGARQANSGVISRSVSGYDLTQVLKNGKHSKRYVVPVGANVINTVRTLLQAYNLPHSIEDSDEVMTAERTYDPGTEIIATINDLLSMINYRSLAFDPNGIAVSQVYVIPADRYPSVGYFTDDKSLVADGATLTLDLFDVPNQVLVVVSQPDKPLITATLSNDNPDSPTSTVNRGYIIPKVYDQNEDVTTQAQANAKAKQYLSEISQVFETIDFSTPIVPVHGENSIVEFTHSELGISQQYSETEWSLPLNPGSLMIHSARRTVAV